MVVKVPPAYRPVGPTASDMTSALAFPLKVAIGAPLVASTAAMRVCVLPPTVPNVPPR